MYVFHYGENIPFGAVRVYVVGWELDVRLGKERTTQRDIETCFFATGASSKPDVRRVKYEHFDATSYQQQFYKPTVSTATSRNAG